MLIVLMFDDDDIFSLFILCIITHINKFNKNV